MEQQLLIFNRKGWCCMKLLRHVVLKLILDKINIVVTIKCLSLILKAVCMCLRYVMLCHIFIIIMP